MASDNTIPVKPAGDYQQVEAYCLMRYRDKRSHEIMIWNSRDAVTPFIVMVNGQEYQHVDWNADRRNPFHRPLPGEYVFIKLTMEIARKYRRRMVERDWDVDFSGVRMSDRWETKEQAVEDLAKSDVESFAPDTPHLAIVAPEGWPKTVEKPVEEPAEEVPRGD